MEHTLFKTRGFTLAQLLTSLLIISVTAFFLAPVFTLVSPNKAKQNQSLCASNLKRIGLAAMLYAQDNDATFPPMLQADDKNAHLWLGAKASYQPHRDGLLTPYLEPTLRLFCTEMPKGSVNGAAYLNNDLCGAARKTDFAAASKTVLFMDGETPFSSVGHAYDPSRADPAVWEHYPLRLKIGEMISDAARRHGGGANYLFADGHVRWFKPEAVFFPPRESMNKTHRDPQTGQSIGPDPSGDMTYVGRKYTATFHLR